MKKQNSYNTQSSNRITKTIISLVLSLIISSFADDKGDIKFRQLTIKQGLSQSRVFDIVQDTDGFIWIATEDGLNRYDGYKFDVFSFDPDDPNSLSNQTIMTLAAGDSGDIWIGTSLGGLNKFDAARQHFISYQHNPDDPKSIPDNFLTYMSRDRAGNLWLVFGWGLIGYFDIATGTCTTLELDGKIITSADTRQIFFVEEDSRGTVWIGTVDGLYRYYPDTKSIKAYRAVAKDPFSISDPHVRCMFEDSRGQLWFGTENGLNLFKADNETFTNFKLNNGSQEESIEFVSAILEAKDGNLWVGTWGNGVYRVDRQSDEVSHYLSDPDDQSSLSENFISVLMEDRAGEIWVGTDLKGVSKLDRAATRFRTISTENSGLSNKYVRDFWVEKSGIIWLGTAGGGLNRYDRRTNEWKIYRHDPANRNSLSSDFLKTLYRDSDGILWIGTLEGLNRFDPAKKSFERIYINPENPESYENQLGYDIIETPAYPGILWFGSSAAGLCSYDKKNKILKTYIVDSSGVQPSAKNFVKSIAYDQNNPARLFVGANDGFNIFDIETETFKSYRSEHESSARRSSDNIMSFYQDEEGNVWIATYGGGFMCFHLDTEETTIYTVQNSDLPSNGVYSIIPDNNGFFWLSSNRGISRFDPRTGIFKNYTVEDGLQNDEFNGGSYFKSFSGEIFFGGIGGYNSFYPESILENMIKPEIMITGFKIFNQKVTASDESPLKETISQTDFIGLEHWQNDISFDFVGLHYFRPENNKYAYILENYDPDWRQVGAIRNAVYTNLDPGEYTFRVRAANSDGIWNEQGKMIAITIYPPWWKTGWAYMGYILLAAMAVFGMDRFQRYRLTQRERQRAQIREAELRAQVAESENVRKSQELEEARKLQLALLPEKLPDLPNLQIAVYMKTATEVGGDYYDFNISADGTLNIAMGDATGHGMQAGTVVTLMKGLFSADAGRMNISDFFSQSNEALKSLRLGRMMMAFTLLKIKDNSLILSSAGMPPAYIYRPANLKVEEILQESMPLGAFKSFDYQIHQSKLAQGDTILLFSDGLPELKNSDGAQFDYPRVEQIFKEEADKPAQDIIDRLVDAGEMWRKDQVPDDDITMMVIKAK